MKIGELSRRMKEREAELQSAWRESLKALEKSLSAITQNALKTFKNDMKKIELSFHNEIGRLRSELRSELKIERWKWLAIGIGIGLAIGIVIGAIGTKKLFVPAYWEVIRGEDGGTYIVPAR